MTTNPKSNKSIRYRSLRMESLEKREMLSAAPIDDTYTLETGGTLIYQVVENETKNAETSANIGGRDISGGAPNNVSFERPE